MRKINFNIVLRFISNIWIIVLISWPLLLASAKLWNLVPYKYALAGFLLWGIVPVLVTTVIWISHAIFKLPTPGDLFLPGRRAPSIYLLMLIIIVPILMFFALPNINQKLFGAISKPRAFNFNLFIKKEVAYIINHSISPFYRQLVPSKNWPEAQLEIRHLSNSGILYLRTEPVCTISIPLYLEFRLNRISSEWDKRTFTDHAENNGLLSGSVTGILDGIGQKTTVWLDKYNDWCVERTIIVSGEAVNGETEKELTNIINAMKRNPTVTHFANNISGPPVQIME